MIRLRDAWFNTLRSIAPKVLVKPVRTMRTPQSSKATPPNSVSNSSLPAMPVFLVSEVSPPSIGFVKRLICPQPPIDCNTNMTFGVHVRARLLIKTYTMDRDIILAL